MIQLLGGPEFDTTTNQDYALYADFHYFFNSGSVVRSNPWNSPVGPVAKTMKVTNITANDVALNYVNTSGTITATTLSGSESRTITSQTLPLGLDFNTLVGLSDNTWLSASFVSNFTGSVTARPTGSRYFEMAAIRTISQATNMYTIADGSTDITKTSLSSPVSGSSLRYACSRTIPYLDQPFWLIRDINNCAGGTTTTTTAGPTTTTTSTSTTTTTTTGAPTTTTTTTLASQKYLLTSCEGPGDIIGVFTITNAPLLNIGATIRIAGGGIAGLYCFTVNNTSTGTSLGTYSITDVWQNAGGDCSDCSE